MDIILYTDNIFCIINLNSTGKLLNNYLKLIENEIIKLSELEIKELINLYQLEISRLINEYSIYPEMVKNRKLKNYNSLINLLSENNDLYIKLGNTFPEIDNILNKH